MKYLTENIDNQRKRKNYALIYIIIARTILLRCRRKVSIKMKERKEAVKVSMIYDI